MPSFLPSPLPHPGDSTTSRKDFQGRKRRDISEARVDIRVKSPSRGVAKGIAGTGADCINSEAAIGGRILLQFKLWKSRGCTYPADVVPAGACTSSMSGFIPRNQSPSPLNSLPPFFVQTRCNSPPRSDVSSLSVSLFHAPFRSNGWNRKRKKRRKNISLPFPPKPRNAGGEAR